MIMEFYILITLLAGILVGYHLGYKKGKEKGIKLTQDKAPLQILEKSLEKGYCLICRGKK